MALLSRILKITLISIGTITVVLIILAFTSAPFWIWYKYSTKHAGINRVPGYIIVLGGGGMPSESGLIRCWYAAKTANHFPGSKIIIALPGDTADKLSSINLMKEEMMLRGNHRSRIILEPIGTNTRAQALEVKKLIEGLKESGKYGSRITDFTHQLLNSPAILIVTSPEHLTRAVLTFKKAGFARVDGIPAFEAAIESDITFSDAVLGGRKWIPAIGENLAFRYRFWTQLQYEELMIRECLALFYYKLKAWI